MPEMQRCRQCGAEWWDSHVCSLPKLPDPPSKLPRQSAPTHFAADATLGPATPEDEAIYKSISDNFHKADDATLARIAELERDAARYQWLKRHCGYFADAIRLPLGFNALPNIDASIDAEIEKEKEK